MMKFLALIICMLCSLVSFADVKVLSIGISDYPDKSGWRKLDANNDVAIMSSTFPEAKTLCNGKATKKGIEDALNALCSRAISGDTVIVHFSGHGQQMLALNDKNEPDGLHEAIVPFDAQITKSDEYSGQYHFADDDFGEELTKLRKAVGAEGLVIAVIDACHSDSMDKDAEDYGDEIYRGTEDIFGAESLSDEQKAELRAKFASQDNSNLSSDNGLGNLILMSGCKTHQRNYQIKGSDGKNYGSLSYYFANAVQRHGLNDVAGLLSEVYASMKNDKVLAFHGQLPVIRNTINWEEPKEIPVTHSISDQEETSSGEHRFPWQPICIGVASIALILILIGYVRRRRKKG